MISAATKFEKITKIILIAISLSLSGFLISLGDKVLRDVTNIFKPPTLEQFLPEDAMRKNRHEAEAIRLQMEQLTDKKDSIQKSLDMADKKYQSEKESFDTWVTTRKTIESPQQDKDVLLRTRKVDELRKIRDDWRAALFDAENSIASAHVAQEKNRKTESEIQGKARSAYDSAMNSYDLKVFLLRLVIAVPVLLIGVFAFIKFRKSRYNAFVWGYSLFALYMFFVGLVPYLPSYGGYVRYSVGIVLTIFVGYYVIRQLNIYNERKKAEINKSATERLKEVAYSTAIKSYEAHTCPSCERNFLTTQNLIQDPADKQPNFCIHCGINLFSRCSRCGQRNFAYFPFCSGCGCAITAEKAP